MIVAKNKQVIVLAVNILSFIKTNVIIAKTVFETPNPINFVDQICSVIENIFLVAYQKHMPMGTAKTTLATTGLFSHQLQTN